MNQKRSSWKRSYTWVLITNAIYIVVFCLIMLIFS